MTTPPAPLVSVLHLIDRLVCAYHCNAEYHVNTLLEELIELHSSSPAFKKAFQSKPITVQYIQLARPIVQKTIDSSEVKLKMLRVLEKVTHLALMVSLQAGIDVQQKEEVGRQEAEIFQKSSDMTFQISLCISSSSPSNNRENSCQKHRTVGRRRPIAQVVCRSPLEPPCALIPGRFSVIDHSVAQSIVLQLGVK